MVGGTAGVADPAADSLDAISHGAVEGRPTGRRHYRSCEGSVGLSHFGPACVQAGPESLGALATSR
jgi:hypothetical protein